MPGEALAGLRVIDLSLGIAGGYCTKLLAGFGAEVIKVEPPGGDPVRGEGPFRDDTPDREASGLFLHLGTGKRSITLDLATEQGRALARRLIATADVLVESFEPGGLDALGLGFETLRAGNPGLVLTSISWFGASGPYSGYAGSELAAWALGGYLMLTGTDEGGPLKGYGNLGQYEAGLQAANGTMAAVLARDLTGRGQQVDVAVYEAIAFLLGGVPQAWYFRRAPVPRVGARLLGMQERVFYPSTLRPCLDGWIHAHTNVRHPDLLAVLMEEPRLADPEVLETPTGNADQIDALMDPWLAQHTRQEVVDRAQELRVPFTAVNSPAEVFNDRNLRERGYFTPVEHPVAGTVEQPGSPYHCSATPWQLCRAPLLGEHNAEVYTELGLSPAEIEELRAGGAI